MLVGGTENTPEACEEKVSGIFPLLPFYTVSLARKQQKER